MSNPGQALLQSSSTSARGLRFDCTIMNVCRSKGVGIWRHQLRLHITLLSTSARNGREANGEEQLWQQFFYNPSEWWDNRLGKRDPDYPDFKHKFRKEALWLDSGSSHEWVKKKLAALLQHQGQSYRLLNDYHYAVDLGDDDNNSRGVKVRISLTEGSRQESSDHGRDLNRGLEAQLVKLPTPCLFSWNSAIAGYAKGGHGEKALELLREMQTRGVKPDKFTFVRILNACGAVADLERGKQVHEEIINSGVKRNLCVWNALVDMYIKCGSLESARQVFERMCQRDLVTWTLMISAYVKSGDSKTALRLFEKMQLQNVEPDRITFVSVLNACASLGALEQGRKLHEQMINSAHRLNIYVWNSLIDMYAKCGSLKDARKVFSRMGSKDVVSWNTMIAGYAKAGQGVMALDLFRHMQEEDVKPDKFTFVTVLNVCARLGALEEGKKIHAEMADREGAMDVLAWNSLVHMYTKCGSKENARKVLDTMRTRT